MKKNLTDITLIIDRSGSMDSCRAEAENGINHFIDDQKAQPGKATFTLVQFDTQYEFVHNGVPIKKVGKYILKPRGMTALNDAIGRAINETGKRLADMREQDRPALVTFLIVTDGEENASTEFNASQVKEMVNRQRSVYSWKFNFLGASEDAILQAQALGIERDSSAVYKTKNIIGTVCSMSGKMSAARSASAVGLDASAALCFNAQDRKEYNQ